MLGPRLCVVTPTRKRWGWLAKQAAALIPQLQDGDLWIIAIDCDIPPPELIDDIAARLGSRLMILELHYARPDPPVGCVNRIRTAAIGAAPGDFECIVEVDDHDIIEPGAIELLRAAMGEGASYVFGDCHQQAIIESLPGENLLEAWPDIRHNYTDDFASEVEVLGVRAFGRFAFEMAFGWQDNWPGGDKALAIDIESSDPSRIKYLPRFLCTVTICSDSIMGRYAREQPAMLNLPANPDAVLRG